MRAVITIISSLMILPVMAEETATIRSRCASAALKQFSAQIAGLRLGAEGKSARSAVEDVLARRRIEEDYCARHVQCIETAPQLQGQKFSYCLDMEADERLRHLTK